MQISSNLVLTYVVILPFPAGWWINVVDTVGCYYLANVKGSMAQSPSDSKTVVFISIDFERLRYGHFLKYDTLISVILLCPCIKLLNDRPKIWQFTTTTNEQDWQFLEPYVFVRSSAAS